VDAKCPNSLANARKARAVAGSEHPSSMGSSPVLLAKRRARNRMVPGPSSFLTHQGHVPAGGQGHPRGAVETGEARKEGVAVEPVQFALLAQITDRAHAVSYGRGATGPVLVADSIKVNLTRRGGSGCPRKGPLRRPPPSSLCWPPTSTESAKEPHHETPSLLPVLPRALAGWAPLPCIPWRCKSRWRVNKHTGTGVCARPQKAGTAQGATRSTCTSQEKRRRQQECRTAQ
jgi:hypothetical protein